MRSAYVCGGEKALGSFFVCVKLGMCDPDCNWRRWSSAMRAQRYRSEAKNDE